MKHSLFAASVVALLAGTGPIGLAQEPPTAKQDTAKGAPATAKPAAAAQSEVPLRLTVTVSKYQGDKKISSLPYTLSISIGGPRQTRFRMGAQVPYATTRESDGTKTPSYSYRDVGVSIDVNNPVLVEPGLYKMEVYVSDSSLSSSNQIQGAPTIPGVPIFRNFSANGSVVLRDGQTGQLTTAADPITGETMRVDVTLTVVK